MAKSKTTCEFSFNILLIGDSFVGKSSLMRSFAGKSDDTISIGAHGLELRRINIGNTPVRVVVFDTIDNPSLRELTKGYYKISVGIILLYAIDDRKTFLNLNSWLDHIKKFADPATVITLLGSKHDLESSRVVLKDEGLKLAREHKINFLEVSAKTGHGVEAAFRITAISVLAKVLDKSIDSNRAKNLRENQ